MGLADILAADILPRVQRPSRYLGNELNSVHKDPDRVRLRACLAFPDSYDLGLGNLGLQILYGILNGLEDVWAERVCAPHPDLEAELRRRGLPLFSLESKTPLDRFDLIGFTLQWELNYTNILNILDLGGIPLGADERREGDPLVIAGGPCVFNPEPLAPFIDCFVVGDGEEVVVEVVDAVRSGSREDKLRRLAAIPGCYVPALYPMTTGPGGVVVPPAGAPAIVKRLVRDFEAAPFPTDYLVPYAEQVHDRVALEVLRGCTQGCRFCQAGMTTRPVRERSLESLAALQQETMKRTGYEEIGLVSLSTCDYSKVKSLVRQSVDLGRPNHVAVSLPSLRLDSFSVDLAHQISSVRKTGITFAPEAATDRMRAVINKFITRDDLLDMARHCYDHGWDTIKLYFMIGLPTETDEDVAAIGELAREVLDVGRRVTSRARVNLGISTFVPKPMTPFQWAEQIPPEETRRRQDVLRRHLGPKAIKFGRHDAFDTWLEGIITRGDRVTGLLLRYAWEEGARFDGWYEYRDESAWTRAIARWEADTGRRAPDELRERAVDEPLPWDHLDVMIPKGWLRHDWDRARSLDWQVDCRQVAGKCNKCGVIDQERESCTTMLRRSREGARAEEELALDGPPTWTEPPPAGKVRFRWSRVGLTRFLSHKETMNAFIRAIRRAELPLRYSEGYHPHASVSFSTALPVGLETEGDYCDVTLVELVDPDQFVARLNEVLPDGFAVHEAWAVAADEPALMALVEAVCYRAWVPRELVPGDLSERVAAVLASDRIEVQRRGKQKGQVVYRPIDIRPMIAAITCADEPDDAALELMLVNDGDRQPKAVEVLGAILGGDEPSLTAVRVRKIASYRRVEGRLEDLRPTVREYA